MLKKILTIMLTIGMIKLPYEISILNLCLFCCYSKLFSNDPKSQYKINCQYTLLYPLVVITFFEQNNCLKSNYIWGSNSCDC